VAHGFAHLCGCPLHHATSASGTRRGFLLGLGALATVGAAGGLAGCAATAGSEVAGSGGATWIDSHHHYYPPE